MKIGKRNLTASPHTDNDITDADRLQYIMLHKLVRPFGDNQNGRNSGLEKGLNGLVNLCMKGKTTVIDDKQTKSDGCYKRLSCG